MFLPFLSRERKMKYNEHVYYIVIVTMSQKDFLATIGKRGKNEIL